MPNYVKPLNWVDRQLKSLHNDRKSNRHKFIALTIIQSIFNLASVAVAIWGIIRLEQNTDSTNLEVILASMAASGVVIIFILNNINIIYRGFMKDKTYKKAMDKIQFEVMEFHNDPRTYNGKDPKAALVKNVDKIYNQAIEKKVGLSFSLFLRAMAGGGHE